MDEPRRPTKPEEFEILNKWFGPFHALPVRDHAGRKEMIRGQIKPELEENGFEGWDEKRIRSWLHNAKPGKKAYAKNYYYRKVVVQRRTGQPPADEPEADADEPEADADEPEADADESEAGPQSPAAGEGAATEGAQGKELEADDFWPFWDWLDTMSEC
jgi:hypothetical protein